MQCRPVEHAFALPLALSHTFAVAVRPDFDFHKQILARLTQMSVQSQKVQLPELSKPDAAAVSNAEQRIAEWKAEQRPWLNVELQDDAVAEGGIITLHSASLLLSLSHPAVSHPLSVSLTLCCCVSPCCLFLSPLLSLSFTLLSLSFTLWLSCWLLYPDCLNQMLVSSRGVSATRDKTW